MCRQFVRLGVVKGSLILGIAALMGTACASHDAPSFKTLSPEQCAPPSQAGYSVSLAADWNTYKPYVRACPLGGSGKAPAKLWLLTVFAQSYLADHPGQTNWPDFPRPQLVTADGRCVARLPELYPFDEPRNLRLRYGPPVDGMPGEIRVHVSNPAVGGDYELPVLRWTSAQHKYIAQNATDEYTKDDMTCPI